VTLFAPLALLGWIPLVLCLFVVLPPRRAAAVSVVGAWLLLPPYVLPIAHLPEKEGRLAEAEAAWRQALDLLAAAAVGGPTAEVQRRWCDCANDLAWLRLHHPEPALRDVGFAVTLARQVVEICPDSEVYWNTLGVAYLRAGDYPAAVAALERATAIGPGATAFDDVFLAMAHAHPGDLEQARQRLAQAMLSRERDYPNQPDLARFCDEARSLLAPDPDHPSPLVDGQMEGVGGLPAGLLAG
jgi:tetratricopeptide (TPR) repeat protein